MKRLAVITFALGAIAFIAVNCGGGLTTSSGKTLVTVNGKKITEGDIEFLGTINPRIRAQLGTAPGKKRILDNLVEQELLYQEAVKQGVNRDPEVRAKAELYRRVIVAQALLEKKLEDAARTYYEEHPEEFKKLGLAHIMIRYQTPGDKKKGRKGKKLRSEKKALKLANEIKEKLDEGGNFKELAKEYSDDAATKRRGGEMGLVAKNDPRFKARGYNPLVEKAFDMKVGEIAGPLKTEHGYHIITVTRGVELQPYEDARRTILFKIKNDVRKDLLAELKKEGSVTYAEELAPKPRVRTKEATPEKEDGGEEKEQKNEDQKEETKSGE